MSIEIPPDFVYKQTAKQKEIETDAAAPFSISNLFSIFLTAIRISVYAETKIQVLVFWQETILLTVRLDFEIET
ncbi:MAG: hypothetical protein J6A10_08035 [Peptococcaceae bacterium]|nr:hypothetical protein [Peptococcaceae bacterium]MBO5429899.1 hypothetical protein [Peptococcaceae bacterium]